MGAKKYMGAGYTTLPPGGIPSLGGLGIPPRWYQLLLFAGKSLNHKYNIFTGPLALGVVRSQYRSC